jgi:transketolase
MIEEHAASIRRNLVKMMGYSKSSHVGSGLSIVDILAVLYFETLKLDISDLKNPSRDIFILSKGHASAALYATLAERGVIPYDWLEKYYIDNGKLPGHLDMKVVPGIECSAGSLGHGLPIGLGMAIAKKKQGLQGRLFVLVGDGELNEGSVWEAIMLASTLNLDNLVLIVDFNHLQGMGRDVISQNNLVDRLTAFGFESLEIDGHDHRALAEVFKISTNRPRAIIARTIKGKGVSFMENKLEWHYKSPNQEQLDEALRELCR